MMTAEYYFLIGGALIYIIYNSKKKSKLFEKEKRKNWVLFEHKESIDGKEKKCYRVENKMKRKISPCFDTREELNGWLLQDGSKQRT